MRKRTSLMVCLLMVSKLALAGGLIPGKIYRAVFDDDRATVNGGYVTTKTEVRVRFTRGKTSRDFTWWAQMEMKTTTEGQPTRTDRILFAGNQLEDLTGPKRIGDKPIGFPVTAFWKYPTTDTLALQRLNEDGSIDAQYYFKKSQAGDHRAYHDKSFDHHLNLYPE